MIKVVHDQHVGKAPSHIVGQNRSVHYWWRVRKAGRRFFSDQYLWACPQCGTRVVKTAGESDPFRRPNQFELEGAGLTLDCMEQGVRNLLQDVMES